MSAADGYGLQLNHITGVGFSVARFYWDGQCESLENVGRATKRIPRFFYVPNGYVELLSVLGIQAEEEKLVADDENITQT